ncbi:hypothetical protein CIPAW_16G024900 [Carya illinoinensis]|uniref:PGG domain-containing protein n=1 Tax=Carya illinoinensis TaxID=32201 RepID=A0A8T1N1L2_CARIL|nr:hypothetical protein CIPAW_16G024900 [Carya illinoinensis]
MEEGNSSLSRSSAVYAPLLRAILEDNWKAAEDFIKKNPNCLVAAVTKDNDTALHFAAAQKRTRFVNARGRFGKHKNPNCLGAPITKEAGTALHNAASGKRTRFVKELVKRMTPEQLELKPNGNCTALYFAAVSEIVTIAEVMVKKNNNLPSIYPDDNIYLLPLYAAIQTGNRDMVSYLYSVTPIQDLASLDLFRLLQATISSDLYDTAHKILDTLELVPGERELLWFSLKDALASHFAKGRNNMLHLAGELPPSDRLNIVSGAALQMQRELLWFQEIEKIVPKSYVNIRNGEGNTPKDIFVRTHEVLQKNGEKWMKSTANSCMIVAALIATVVFPAAFTVPGGNDQGTGIPIFLESNWFTLFFVSDAVAMVFSSSSILIFLTILMSRYTENDFLISLPRKLALGLATLLISIIGMLIAFSAACFLVLKYKTSVPIRIIVAGPAVPISLFAILQHSLWYDIFRSAFYTKRFLFGSHNRLFKQ